MKILYFAALRRIVATAEEEVSPPPSIATVGQLKVWLAAQSPRHAAALAPDIPLCAAVNQEYASMDHGVSADDEVAFFPPVTGG